jgi:hypothetical protein
VEELKTSTKIQQNFETTNIFSTPSTFTPVLTTEENIPTIYDITTATAVLTTERKVTTSIPSTSNTFPFFITNQRLPTIHSTSNTLPPFTTDPQLPSISLTSTTLIPSNTIKQQIISTMTSDADTTISVNHSETKKPSNPHITGTIERYNAEFSVTGTEEKKLSSTEISFFEDSSEITHSTDSKLETEIIVNKREIGYEIILIAGIATVVLIISSIIGFIIYKYCHSNSYGGQLHKVEVVSTVNYSNPTFMSTEGSIMII